MSCSVAADGVKAGHADNIVLLVDLLVKRNLQHGSSNCLSRSLHKCGLQCDGMVAILCSHDPGVVVLVSSIVLTAAIFGLLNTVQRWRPLAINQKSNIYFYYSMPL